MAFGSDVLISALFFDLMDEAYQRGGFAVPSPLTTAALVGVGVLAGGLMLWGWRQARRP